MRPVLTSALLLVTMCLMAALHADPASDIGMRWLVYGKGLSAQNRFPEAIQAFGSGLSAAPNSAALYDVRGLAEWRLGQRTAALQDLRQSLVLDPTQTALSAWLKNLDSPTGEASPAPKSSLSEDDLEDQLANAQSALESRALPKALTLFQSGASEAPTDPVWLKGETETLYAEGRFDDARVVLAQARRLAPDDADIKRMQDHYYPSGLDADSSRGSVWGALWRSALLPGWGQAYNRQKGKAWTVGIVTLSLLAATIVTYVATDQAIARYRGLGAGSDFNAAFSEADDLAIANEIVGITFYSAYAWNVFDAGTHVPGPEAPLQSALPRPARLTLLAWQF